MTHSFPDDRPAIPRLSRYVVGPAGAAMLGDLILEAAPAMPSYSMPTIWNGAFIDYAREAFADYCRRRGL